MKKITLSLLALSLLNASAAFADTVTPVPAAIANHEGPIRIAVIRNPVSYTHLTLPTIYSV